MQYLLKKQITRFTHIFLKEIPNKKTGQLPVFIFLFSKKIPKKNGQLFIGLGTGIIYITKYLQLNLSLV